MELSQIKQRISVVNAESKRLNNERQVNIGKREALERQLSDALNKYNSTYNTTITADTLQAEMQRIITAKEAELVSIEQVLNLIKTGDFKGAEALILKSKGVEAPEAIAETPAVELEETVVPPTAEVVPPTTTAVPSATEVVPPVVEPQVAQPTVPTAPVLETPVAPPMTQVTPPTVHTAPPTAQVLPPTTPVAPPAVEPQVTQPTVPLSGLDIPATPPNFGTPPDLGFVDKPAEPPKVSNPPNLGGTEEKSDMSGVTSFNAILGGQAFNPVGTN
jgi:hypothetical protein